MSDKKIKDTAEFRLSGKCGAEGIAIGKAYLLTQKTASVTPRSINEKDIGRNKEQFFQARTALLNSIDDIPKEVREGETGDILETQKHIIKDPEIEKGVIELIEEKLLSADFAVYQTYCQFIERLKESGSELFRQRIIDLEDLRDRFVRYINGKSENITIDQGAVLVVKDMSPADLVSYYEDGAAALIMEKGGATSHAAIIASSLGLPCIINAESATRKIKFGDNLIVDSTKGEIIVHPKKQTLKKYSGLKRKENGGKMSIISEPSVTKDNEAFSLSANIEFEAELPNISKYNASGIGLLRTESLLFSKEERSDFDSQVTFYRKVMQASNDLLTIRLFDIGGDKLTRESASEDNPFLGWRGIRLLLDKDELLNVQLRAIQTVAGEFPGKIRILVPMVSSLNEVHRIKEKVYEVQRDLESENIPIDREIKIGLMVEVPVVAIMSEIYAGEVDFFSIGTNDLTQYTLAVDRGNQRISKLFQHYDPAVLRLIQRSAEGAKACNIPISVCGELAGSLIGAACILGLGIRTLSMNPVVIPKIKKLLTSYTLSDFEEFALKAINLSGHEEVERLFKGRFSI